MGTLKLFEAIIIGQLFYAFAVTLIVYSLPSDTINYVNVFQTDVSLENTSVQIQQSVQKQMDIPIVDLGALVFYSGNIMVDLMLNFLTAVPGMFSLILTALFAFINVDAFIATQLKLFATTVTTVIYVMMVLNFVMQIRTRGTII